MLHYTEQHIIKSVLKLCRTVLRVFLSIVRLLDFKDVLKRFLRVLVSRKCNKTNNQISNATSILRHLLYKREEDYPKKLKIKYIRVRIYDSAFGILLSTNLKSKFDHELQFAPTFYILMKLKMLKIVKVDNRLSQLMESNVSNVLKNLVSLTVRLVTEYIKGLKAKCIPNPNILFSRSEITTEMPSKRSSQLMLAVFDFKGVNSLSCDFIVWQSVPCIRCPIDEEVTNNGSFFLNKVQPRASITKCVCYSFYYYFYYH
ncbi:hypothetical protein BpHYR1_046328 [Brachionus plicatilis]|uniref:Uncharacterized protein n=1 Tax=Brachionus plicatilis TaxID=10195 RepID=A0A3M7QGV3_BRAPC|nr:hypothetical protein BpHYR1_046328 [Brachionus plicatilis]